MSGRNGEYSKAKNLFLLHRDHGVCTASINGHCVLLRSETWMIRFKRKISNSIMAEPERRRERERAWEVLDSLLMHQREENCSNSPYLYNAFYTIHIAIQMSCNEQLHSASHGHTVCISRAHVNREMRCSVLCFLCRASQFKFHLFVPMWCRQNICYACIAVVVDLDGALPAYMRRSYSDLAVVYLHFELSLCDCVVVWCGSRLQKQANSNEHLSVITCDNDNVWYETKMDHTRAQPTQELTLCQFRSAINSTKLSELSDCRRCFVSALEMQNGRKFGMKENTRWCQRIVQSTLDERCAVRFV